jgi:O-antigen/teichoic acid export membrane protein
VFNKTAVFAALGRIAQAGGVLLSIPLIASKLSGEEQGYYYTFISLAALQVFLELGITGVIIQSIAHEVTHLKISVAPERPIWLGENIHKIRIAAFIRFSGYWFFFASFATLLGLSIGGYLFLKNTNNENHINNHWIMPWLSISFITSLSVLASGALAILEGIGGIRTASIIRLFATTVGLCGLIIGLLQNLGLWALCLNMGISLTINLLSLKYIYRPILASLKEVADKNYRWKTEIWPLQWRIAISWMSGWFIFQSMTPAIFKNCGPEAAGKFGLALQIANGVQSISSVWFQTRVPIWGMYISKRKWQDLNIDFKKNTSLSIISAIFISCSIVAILAYFDSNFKLYIKHPPSLYVVVILVIAAILNQWIFSIAAYLRAHKKEPFLIVSVAWAACMLVVIKTPYLCNEKLIATSYALITLIIGGFLGTIIWYRCTQKWHEKYKQQTSHNNYSNL